MFLYFLQIAGQACDEVARCSYVDEVFLCNRDMVVLPSTSGERLLKKVAIAGDVAKKCND